MRPNCGLPHHALDRAQSLQLLETQLQRSANTAHRGLAPMQRRGRSGIAFLATLGSHGHTFVGMGTSGKLRKDLLHEADMYRRMLLLQGQTIPVLLGSLDLVLPVVPHANGAVLEHMLLLSWGGEEAWRLDLPHSLLQYEVARWLRDIWQAGVHHPDIADRNVVWNEELQRAVIIDYIQGCSRAYPRVQRRTKQSVAKSFGRRRLERLTGQRQLRISGELMKATVHSDAFMLHSLCIPSGEGLFL
jgi:hypothetical protein